MMSGEQPTNPYEPPEHGGTAATNGLPKLPLNRKRVVRAVLIWIGFIGFGGVIKLLYEFTSVPEQPPTWLAITVLVIGMLHSFAFLAYHILLIIWILRGHFRRP